jgi:hypothetical protein
MEKNDTHIEHFSPEKKISVVEKYLSPLVTILIMLICMVFLNKKVMTYGHILGFVLSNM